MTYSDATAAAGRGDCSAQNNLDYIFQFVNGWMQNKSGYDIGKYCESRRLMMGSQSAYASHNSQSEKLLRYSSDGNLA